MFSKIKNYAIKSAAILLSATTIISTGAPNASAATVATSQINHQTSASNQIIRFEKSRKNLLILGGFYLAIAVATGLALYSWDSTEVKTAISKLSPEEVDKEISKQVQIYIDRAPDVFEFDDGLKAKVDHRILLLSLMKINYLFDKYENFTKSFIEFKKSSGIDKKFRLLLGDYEAQSTGNHNHMSRAAIMDTTIDRINFAPFGLGDYSSTLGTCRHDQETGFLSQTDPSHLPDYYITHEFGHLMEMFYLTQKSQEIRESYGRLDDACGEAQEAFQSATNDKTDRKRATDKLVKAIENFYSNLDKIASPIKGEILQGLEGNARKISDYGETNALEFFAEAFAHLECADKPRKINKIGRRTESYLVNTMGFLPREKSKFNK